MNLRIPFRAMAAEFGVVGIPDYSAPDIVEEVGVYQFVTFYHPWVCQAIRRMNDGGVRALLGWPMEPDLTTALPPSSMTSMGAPGTLDLKANAFHDDYLPNSNYVEQPYPEFLLDFSLPEMTGAYSQYNWELFFFAPLAIAEELTRTQQYQAAMQWYQYIFNPTNRSGDSSQQRCWTLRPFYDEVGAILKSGSPPDLPMLLDKASVIVAQVAAWQDRPFEPHLIAQLRPPAYEKAVVMKYVDNLIGWGDQLFRQDTIESINQATQLYVLAADLLGPKPELIPEQASKPAPTFNDLLAAAPLDAKSLADLENLLPHAASMQVADESAAESAVALVAESRYFCVPPNAQLYGYWQTIADRLFKVRNCLNIEGVAQQLPLFEPPIDPGLLVAARAAGVDLASVVSGLSMPVPNVRYRSSYARAVEVCADVRSFGAALLAALEKGDSEALARLRSTHEIDLLTAMRDVKQSEVGAAQATLDGLTQAQAATQARLKFYQTRVKVSPGESEQLDQLRTAQALREAQVAMSSITALLFAIPDLKLGVPTTDGATTGGSLVAGAFQAMTEGIGSGAQMAEAQAGIAAINASQDRRWDEWQNQIEVLTADLAQIGKQIVAATLRVQIAQKALDNHDLQSQQAQEVDDFLKNKHAPQELYDWMVEQLSTVYFQSYQLAYDLAKRAEMAWQFEIGALDGKTTFITPGQWESLHRGLLAGERLNYDLKRMEAAYLDQNARTFEVTKLISLRQFDPTALLQLREEGSCTIALSESDFDADFPGHRQRRIKSVALSLPCVTGQFETVNCTLTLLQHTIRVDAQTTWTSPIPSSQIVTSLGQNDSGLFEVNLHDERYLPFEGAGVESQWQIELPLSTNTFARETLADAILHLRYTAKPGQGSAPTKAAPPQPGRLFSLRDDFPDAWEALLDSAPPTASISLGSALFPVSNATTVQSILVLARLADGVPYTSTDALTVGFTAPNAGTATAKLTSGVSFGKAPVGTAAAAGGLPLRSVNADRSVNSGWLVALTGVPSTLTDLKTGHIDPSKLLDLMVLFYY